jgi:hypothetical protein
LLENIKKHDTNNIIKTISVDLLRSLQKPIDPKIHSVPALLLTKTKEYLFGKAVFDYLLLPNRGILFSNTITRDDKNSKKENIVNNTINTEEPSAFTLGNILSENFSSIEDDDNNTNSVMSDKNYNWEFINNTGEENKIVTPVDDNKGKDTNDDKNGKKLPSMEELLKQRASDIT